MLLFDSLFQSGQNLKRVPPCWTKHDYTVKISFLKGCFGVKNKQFNTLRQGTAQRFSFQPPQHRYLTRKQPAPCQKHTFNAKPCEKGLKSLPQATSGREAKLQKLAARIRACAILARQSLKARYASSKRAEKHINSRKWGRASKNFSPPEQSKNICLSKPFRFLY